MTVVARERSLVVETVHFASEGYQLEGELAYGEDETPLGGVVLAGPHPLLGGTMHNNVIRSLGDGLAERGRPSLRFDYRGVGRSQGPAIDPADQFDRFWRTSHTDEEASCGLDLAAAVGFLRATLGDAAPLALVGYSFGCSLLPSAGASQSTPLVLIAPTPGVHDYAAFTAVPNPLLVVVSENDFAVDAAELRRWFDGLRGPKRLIREQLDNHFFRGHEAWLVETVNAFLAEEQR
jgi:alpha/beta superfamily hydrolase